MDQEHVSRDQLLERIRDLEMLNRQLLREKEEETRLEYAWTGNLGHWYWNVKTNEVTFNPLKVICGPREAFGSKPRKNPAVGRGKRN